MCNRYQRGNSHPREQSVRSITLLEHATCMVAIRFGSRDTRRNARTERVSDPIHPLRTRLRFRGIRAGVARTGRCMIDFRRFAASPLSRPSDRICHSALPGPPNRNGRISNTRTRECRVRTKCPSPSGACRRHSCGISSGIHPPALKRSELYFKLAMSRCASIKRQSRGHKVYRLSGQSDCESIPTLSTMRVWGAHRPRECK